MTAESTVFCTRCGTQFNGTSKFCTVCGEPRGAPDLASGGAHPSPPEPLSTKVEHEPLSATPFGLPPPGVAAGSAPSRNNRRIAMILACIGVVVLIALGALAALLLRGGSSTKTAALAPAATVTQTTTVGRVTTVVVSPTPTVKPSRSPPRTDDLSLTSRMVVPGAPYRCVSPFARDHTHRMALYLLYANGTPLDLVSSGPGDTTADFLFCGGSAGYNRFGLASAPLRFTAIPGTRRIARITGILGSDWEATTGQLVELDVLYAGRSLCHFSTDGLGHARRFSCSAFPSRSTVDNLTLRFNVPDDATHGVYAGIAHLGAVIVFNSTP